MTTPPSSPSILVPRMTVRWAADGRMVLTLAGDWILEELVGILAAAVAAVLRQGLRG